MEGNDHEVEFHEIKIRLFHEIKIRLDHEIEIGLKYLANLIMRLTL
jgi:hypothetical protein